MVTVRTADRASVTAVMAVTAATGWLCGVRIGGRDERDRGHDHGVVRLGPACPARPMAQQRPILGCRCPCVEG
jgi:hypothetical protein